MKAIVNGKKEFELTDTQDKDEHPDFLKVDDSTYHLIKDMKGFKVTVIQENVLEKTFVIRVNGIDYDVSLKDKNDLLLQKLGIKIKSQGSVPFIKAPMPGLITQVSVKPGDEVKKGDSLLILEAMKMENVLKSPRDGVIKELKAGIRDTVEKNTVLVVFE